MMLRRTRLAALSLGILFVLCGIAENASAKDLQGRLGLGYNAQFSNTQATNGVPALSLKYGATKDLALEAVIGVATTSPGNSVFGAKIFKNLFYETNLNFYFLAGGGLVAASGNSGAEFIGGFGAEFFIPGIESLGFSTEFGGSFSNLTGTFILRTMGISFINAGIRFYF
ncbi:MAG: hypothetical protein JNL01_09900 [Bdellovibrionales bacterium]|nr:hypothetical protein [Bdellovibrionales bacterium]